MNDFTSYTPEDLRKVVRYLLELNRNVALTMIREYQQALYDAAWAGEISFDRHAILQKVTEEEIARVEKTKS